MPIPNNKAQDEQPENPQQTVFISADNGGTAVGSVGQMNLRTSGLTSIDHVENLHLVQRMATAAVSDVTTMRPRSGAFVGRDEQIRQLGHFLDDTSSGAAPIGVITGPPGVGKTELVRVAAARSTTGKTFARAVFADMRGYEENAADRVQASELFASLLSGLGVANSEVPEAVGQQQIAFHRLLEDYAQSGRAVLLWFDNVGDRSQLEGLFPENVLHRIVVTTRGTFPKSPDQMVIDLDVLSTEEAVQLLEELDDAGTGRIRSAPYESERLARLCDRLPLALQIVGALAADEPDRPMKDLADELEEEEHRLDTLHYDDRLSVRAALVLSYKRLSPDLQLQFCLLSQVPGGDVGLTAATWLTKERAAAVRHRLMALVRAHLVQQHVANRWSMHDLVRLFAAEVAADDHSDAAEVAIRNLVACCTLYVGMTCEWLTAVASETTRKVFAKPADASSWFEAERTTATSIVRQLANRQDFAEVLTALGVVLSELLRSQTHWRTDFHEVAATTAKVAERITPQVAVGSALSNYGTSLRKQGHISEARDAFDRAIQVYQEIGEPARASGVRSNIANLLLGQGHVDDAIELYRQDLAACPPEAHPYSAAITLSNWGAALVTANQPSEAIDPLQRSVALRRALDDRSGLASGLLNLGRAYYDMAEQKNTQYLTLAAEAFEESRQIRQSLQDRKGEADSSNNLGHALANLRRFDESALQLSAAYDYYVEAGDEVQAQQTMGVLKQVESAARRHR